MKNTIHKRNDVLIQYFIEPIHIFIVSPHQNQPLCNDVRASHVLQLRTRLKRIKRSAKNEGHIENTIKID